VQDDVPTSDDAALSSGSTPSPGSIQSRVQAFRTLDQLARFFRQTEPLSPIAFELEKIVRWGKMEFPDLMKELISKPEALEDLFRQTGINSGSGDGGQNPPA
jgi:type VI secretion system protein ImpA